jgi:thiol-disulfide isomerase/thioredoxin
MINAKTLHELDVTVQEACASGKLVVVNFFAPECYACKSMQPKLRQIASSNPDTLFIKVNGFLDEFRAYCDAMGITKIPYFHLYRSNKRVSEFTANMRPEKLALLRAEIAAQKPSVVSSADTVQYQTLEV